MILMVRRRYKHVSMGLYGVRGFVGVVGLQFGCSGLAFQECHQERLDTPNKSEKLYHIRRDCRIS